MCFLGLKSLLPVWHTLRALFGVSLLYYGYEFRTLAFHIIIFRLSGWTKVTKSVQTLKDKYVAARQAMVTAAKNVYSSGRHLTQQEEMDSLKKSKQEMIAAKKRMLEDGIITEEEAREFANTYRKELEQIDEEQRMFASAQSSVLALNKALSVSSVMETVNGLYAALITSITASTFKTAGRLTLALHCAALLKTHLFDLLGPWIDPVGYALDLDTYTESGMRGYTWLTLTSIAYITVWGLFRLDPQHALQAAMVYYGARVVTDYVVKVANPIRRRMGLPRMNHTPLSASVHLALTVSGFVFRGNAGPALSAICEPYIGLLCKVNQLLLSFQLSTINYFS